TGRTAGRFMIGFPSPVAPGGAGVTVWGVSETASDTAGTGTTPPVTEEQLRELLARLRQTPVEQVVAELLTSLLNAAQAKLGRRDARLLIDLSGLMIDHARRYVSKGLADQVDQALTQLRLGQVRAESEAASGPAARRAQGAGRPRAPAAGAAGGGAHEAPAAPGAGAATPPAPPGAPPPARGASGEDRPAPPPPAPPSPPRLVASAGRAR